MVDKMSENWKMFRELVFTLRVLGVSKYKSQSNENREIFLGLISFCLMFVFLWPITGNLLHQIDVLYQSNNTVVNSARAVDRAMLSLVLIGICLDDSFRNKQELRIASGFDHVDKILLKHFDIIITYGKMKFWLLVLAMFLAFPFFMIALKGFVLKFGQFVIGVVRVYHIALVVQFLVRLRIVEKLLCEKSRKLENEEKVAFIELFRQLFDLIDIFNESFGLIALMLIGKEIVSSFDTDIHDTENIFSVKSFLRIATRVFEILVVYSESVSFTSLAFLSNFCFIIY